jgi:hypothetical protein
VAVSSKTDLSGTADWGSDAVAALADWFRSQTPRTAHARNMSADQLYGARDAVGRAVRAVRPGRRRAREGRERYIRACMYVTIALNA